MSYLDVVSWKSLGQLSYRCVAVYSPLSWPDIKDLSDYVVCGASFGGPIATWLNTSKMTVLASAGCAAPDTLSVFSGSGRPLACQAVETYHSRLAGMGWNAAEMVVLIFENGSVDLYDVKGVLSPKSFSLFSGLSRERVEDVVIVPHGLAAVTRTSDNRYNCYVVHDWDDPTPQVIDDTGLAYGVRPTCLSAIDSDFTMNGKLEILLGTPEKSIIVVDSEGHPEDQQLDSILSSVPQMMAVSPGGKFLAAFCEDAILTVIDTAFEKKLLEYDTKATSRPVQLIWCSEDAIIAAWPDRVVLIGPYGDSLQLDYDSAVHLIQEVDGARILTATSHEFLQLVPEPLKNIRSIGSTAPSAMVTVAAAKFEEESADCDDMIRALIHDETLKDAVTECIGAALHEWEPSHQRNLLRAASYAKNFDMEYESHIFVEACKKLRVLNSLRSYDAGMALTAPQFDAVSPPVIVDRLCARNNYKLALSICEYIGLGKDKVLVHWACSKVKSSKTEADEALRDKIRKNLAGIAGVSFADIAAAADSAGRRRLATMLLDFEPRAADQVPILLKMREGALALQKALESGDTDLVALCLVHLKRHAALEHASDGQEDDSELDEKFLRMVLQYPAAVDQLSSYYRERGHDPLVLVRLFFSSNRFSDAGQILLHVAFEADSADHRMTFLKRAVEAFKEGEKASRAPASEKASCSFYRMMTEEQIGLMMIQHDLQHELDTRAFDNLSLSDTLFNILVLGDGKKANQLKDVFKIPDTEFWYTKIRALAHTRDWPSLWKFAEEKKSPIGYRPFVEICVEADAVIEAKRYVAKLPEYNDKVDTLISLGAFTDAAELAMKQKDLDKLNAIGGLARTPAAIEAVEKAILALTGGRR